MKLLPQSVCCLLCNQKASSYHTIMELIKWVSVPSKHETLPGGTCWVLDCREIGKTKEVGMEINHLRARGWRGRMSILAVPICWMLGSWVLVQTRPCFPRICVSEQWEGREGLLPNSVEPVNIVSLTQSHYHQLLSVDTAVTISLAARFILPVQLAVKKKW